MPSRPSGDTRASAMHLAVAASSTSSMGASTTSASRRLVAASAAGLADSKWCARRSTSRSRPSDQGDFVHQAQRARLHSGEFLGGEHVTRGLARAHGAHQVRRDGGGDDAQLAPRTARSSRASAATTMSQAAARPDAAAERVTLHARDHRPRAGMHGGEHARHLKRVGVVFGVTEAGHRAHPVEIRAGAEHRARAPPPRPRVFRRDASTSAKAAAISAISASLKALRTSGRLSHSQRTAPRCSTSMCW